MNEQDSKRFVYLSVLWCELRHEFHTTKSMTRRQEIRKRKEQIEAEQEALLEKAKSHLKSGS
jgi:hypothetical protein